MVKFIVTIALCLVSYFGTSQVLDTAFNGYLSPFITVSGSSPTWVVQGKFINEGRTFSGSEVSTDAKVIIASGGRCYELTVDSVITASATMKLEITDPSTVLTSLPNIAVIARPDSNDLFPFISGASDILQSCVQSQNSAVLAGLIAPRLDVCD